MIEQIEMRSVYPEAGILLDLIAEAPKARALFSHGFDGFEAALASRGAFRYPRASIADVLAQHNLSLGAEPATAENIATLRDASTFAVITGQQAGFLGGPVYTFYKLLTVIRLAETLRQRLDTHVVPLYWLASDDHDFEEVNRTYALKDDGEVGAIRFEWPEAGRPIADLRIDSAIAEAAESYWGSLAPHLTPELRHLFRFLPEDSYCSWHARIWLRVFSSRGLVVVDPAVLRQAAVPFLDRALRDRGGIERALRTGARRLAEGGYVPPLDPERAGRVFTVDESGRRVRVTDPADHANRILDCPERYSADAALRPLLADTLLPVVASVLGPGEFAYHAMLRPLYEHLSLPQPLLFPRKTYTVISCQEAELADRFDLPLSSLFDPGFDVADAVKRAVPASLVAAFDDVRTRVSRAVTPLEEPLQALDPGLARTLAQTASSLEQAVDRLEKRARRAALARQRLSPSHLHRLRNAILPRGRPQERVFPLAHFLSRFGSGFIDHLSTCGRLDDVSHHLVRLETPHD